MQDVVDQRVEQNILIFILWPLYLLYNINCQRKIHKDDSFQWIGWIGFGLK